MKTMKVMRFNNSSDAPALIAGTAAVLRTLSALDSRPRLRRTKAISYQSIVITFLFGAAADEPESIRKIARRLLQRVAVHLQLHL
jgi:hypothetical protein